MADDSVLASYSAPSAAEARSYYQGMAGTPHLVARTSTTVWQPTLSDFNGPPRMVRSVVGDHILARRWSPALRNGIIAALDADDSLAWHTFYPIRTGDIAGSDWSFNTRWDGQPVVLLVGVWPDARRTWAAAMRAALRCRDVLRDHGVSAVDVEIMEHHVGPFASSASSPASSPAASPEASPAASPAAFPLLSCVDWNYSRVPPLSLERDLNLAGANCPILPLLPFPGCRLEQEPSSRPEHARAESGTLGLFITLEHKILTATEPASHQAVGQDSDAPRTVYGITNRHVVVGRRVPNDQEFHPTQHGKPQLRILSAGPEYVQEKWMVLNGMKPLLRLSASRAQRGLALNPDNEPTALLYKLRNDCIAYVDGLQKQLENLQEADPAQRILGSVAYAPSHSLDSHGNIRDWALVQMTADAARHADNKVLMVEPAVAEDPVAADGSVGRPLPEQDSKRMQYLETLDNLDAEGFLRLHSRDLPAQPLFAMEEHRTTTVLVAKRGQRSGLSVGVTNNIEAVRRTPLDDGRSIISLHYVVLGIGRWLHRFSEPGDSGSCVFDLTGRVMGVVDGGATAANAQTAGAHGGMGLDTTLPQGSQTEAAAGPSAKSRDAPHAEVDVTFVTPIQWILEGIRDVTGCEPQIV